jgi:hypothetical protein
MTLWDFRQQSKWTALAICKGTDMIQSHQFNNANGTDTQCGPAFESPQHATLGLSVKTLNKPGRTANCFQVSLPRGHRIQSSSLKTLLDAWRTHLLIFANEVMDPSVQGRWSFMWRRRSVREGLLGAHRWNSTAPGEVSFHIRQGTGEVFRYFSPCN